MQAEIAERPRPAADLDPPRLGDEALHAGMPTGLACLVAVALRHGVHLSVDQLLHDNVLSGGEVSTGSLLKCAGTAGLKAKAVQMTWAGLRHLGKATPVIVTFTNGARMVLLGVEGEGEATRAVLQDPYAGPHSRLEVDRIRFEDAWQGEVILVKRDYDIADETQPFGFGLVTALIFRERWIVRDVAISAVVLGFLALTPIMFWRLLSDRVLYFRATNTFYVLCLAFGILVLFEAIFAYTRQLLVVHLTTRVDVKLATYVFDKLLNLPIDFFERTQVGKITHDVYQMWKIRNFLMGQLFGTVLDSATLLVFIPIMFFFSPLMTFIVLATCAVMSAWLICMLPFIAARPRRSRRRNRSAPGS